MCVVCVCRNLDTAIGAATHGESLAEWCNHRSHNRTWMRTEGNEWDLIRHNPTFTGKFHVFRLLSNGLRGLAHTRPNRMCTLAPWIYC